MFGLKYTIADSSCALCKIVPQTTPICAALVTKFYDGSAFKTATFSGKWQTHLLNGKLYKGTQNLLNDASIYPHETNSDNNIFRQYVPIFSGSQQIYAAKKKRSYGKISKAKPTKLPDVIILEL